MTVWPGDDSFGHGERWIGVRQCHSAAEANQLALVLIAAGIRSTTIAMDSGLLLLVAVADGERAQREILAYESENRPAPAPARPTRPLGDGVTAALAAVAAVVFTFVASNRGAFSFDWLGAGVAQAGRMVGDGEWARAITALGLHADLGHIASNVGMGVLFGLLIAQLVGGGLAWLAILVGGGLGNAVNAALQPATHGAIGASTAVFAALGILAVLSLGGPRLTWRRGLRRWAPLGAAVMVFAGYGVGGERTDVGAHITGLVMGCAVGAVLYAFRHRIPQGRMAQVAYGAAALALFAGAWGLALATYPSA